MLPEVWEMTKREEALRKKNLTGQLYSTRFSQALNTTQELRTMTNFDNFQFVNYITKPDLEYRNSFHFSVSYFIPLTFRDM